MSMWMMYLVLKLDDIHLFLHEFQPVLAAPLFLLGLGLIMSYVPTSIRQDDESGCKYYIKKIFPKLLTIFKALGITWIIVILFGILMPTTKQAAAIYFLPKMINNQQVQKMPDKLVILANDWMDEQIKSIRRKK